MEKPGLLVPYRLWRKGGRFYMSIDVKQFELDRITNALRSFGWSVVKSEFAGDTVTCSLEKVVSAQSPDLKRVELDRIVNMMRSFGWTVSSQEMGETKLTVGMNKTVKPEVPK